ncbi:hypothetical protein HSB1_46440 [Halogranum salarium B-1]|uniref:Uncharacterized protein n=1 Tax=Halogranum salarium B-1 TaxID=1210908 RepID=J2ZW64_9EURY|nr:hypothetical protein HSB1_46440 [Halogranum salarium B-1]
MAGDEPGHLRRECIGMENTTHDEVTHTTVANVIGWRGGRTESTTRIGATTPPSRM